MAIKSAAVPLLFWVLVIAAVVLIVVVVLKEIMIALRLRIIVAVVLSIA